MGMSKHISQDEYNAAFLGGSATASLQTKRERALEHALDIRKFEIQLYWTRASYFWTFIGAAFAAYGGVQTVDDAALKADLSVPLSCIGLVFSVAWLLANRGSKQWQENWENHVDLLEDDVTGPLYKVVLRRPPPHDFRSRVSLVLTGPGPYSVSKINQIVSLYLCTVWIALLFFALPPFGGPPSPLYVSVVLLAAGAIALMLTAGKTFPGDYVHRASRRMAGVEDPLPPNEVTRDIAS
jgi:hypothetical protein